MSAVRMSGCLLQPPEALLPTMGKESKVLLVKPFEFHKSGSTLPGTGVQGSPPWTRRGCQQPRAAAGAVRGACKPLNPHIEAADQPPLPRLVASASPPQLRRGTWWPSSFFGRTLAYTTCATLLFCFLTQTTSGQVS